MGQSSAHDQYADEQLQNMQKRICLIEFLRYVLFLFIKGDEWVRHKFKTGILPVLNL